MIETAYERNGWLCVRINGSEKTITCLSAGDRLEGFTSTGVTYVKDGWRRLWTPNGEKTINHV